jgi:peptide/nickel transport system substrate-binding protein
MKFKRSIIAISVFSIAMLTLGCSEEKQELQSETPSLAIHVPDQDERLMGPLGADPWFMVFLGLADGSESSDNPEPRLLDRWEHTPDYTEWTVHVRDGLQWGDGVPVTAKDVKFSLELWTNPNIGYEYRFFDEITVLDNQNLRMNFKEPVSSKIFVFNWLAMLPSHLLEDQDLDSIFSWPFWIQPVGNGPYRYTRHIPGVMMELDANPDYFGEAPGVPKVLLKFGGNALTELLSGNVDIASSITPLQAVQLEKDPRFRIYHRIRYQSHIGILWNHRNPLFQDAKVRKALTLAIDRRELNQVLNFPVGLPIFDVPAVKRHHVRAVVPEPMPYDPELAGQLLAQAGWVDTNNDGIREKDGLEFRFSLSTTEMEAAKAVYIQDKYRRIGVHMDIDSYDRGALMHKIREPHDFDAAIHAFNHIEEFRGPGHSGYENAEVSRLRDVVWYSIDQEVADKALRELWEIFEAEIPVTYLHHRLSYLAAHRRVDGLKNDIHFYSAVERLTIKDENSVPDP